MTEPPIDSELGTGYYAGMGLIGWILFLASSVFFLVSAMRNGDVPAVIGSVLFLVACLLFVAPNLRKPR